MSTNLEILENVWNANPGGLAFAQYAHALQDAGRAPEAKTVLTQGLANWPRHFTGRLLLGMVNQQLGDLDGARASFQEAVALDQRSPAALRSLAVVLGKQQYQRQAVDMWVRLSLLDPEDREIAATARKMISDLESTSSLADLGMGVREVEDIASREALTEGTSSDAGTMRGMSGVEVDSPLAGWSEPGVPSAGKAGFDLGDLAFPVPPSTVNPQQNWSVAGMDSTVGQVPVLPGASTTTMPELSVPKMTSSEDSALATLEMASFPAQTIPPPPLSLPRNITQPGNESATRLLNVAPGEAAPEVTQAMSREQMARVTGDDIGNRLDDLFGEPKADALPGLENFSDALAETVTQPTIPLMAPPPPAPMPAPSSMSAPPTRVTGEDVEGRLSEIFGSVSDPEPEPANLPPPPSLIQPARTEREPAKNAVTGDDIEARLDDLFGASSVDLPIHQTSSRHPLEASASSAGPVSGVDVEARIDAMFGVEDSMVADKNDGEETSAMERSSVLGDGSEIDASATIESMRTFQEAATIDKNFGSMDPSDVDSGGSTMDLPTASVQAASVSDAQRIAGSKDLDSQLDELFASSEFFVEQAPPPVPQRAAGVDGPVTGDDIGDRLDDLFGTDSDFPAGVPTVTLAEEYLKQGYRDQAIAVYKQLVAREPQNQEFAQRLVQIEAAEG